MAGKGKDYRFLKSALGLFAGHGLLQGEGDKLERGVEYRMLTGIVDDVISNPYTYLRKKVDADKTLTVGDILSGRKKSKDVNIGIQNSDLIDSAPINSIIAQVIDPGISSKDGELPVLCYPFFPPHLSLPLKPGEYVWLIECDVKGAKMYYWMCRQVGTIHVDDLNHTNMERIVSAGTVFENFIKSEKTKKPADDMLQESTSLNNYDEVTNSKTSFAKLYANSNAYRSEFTGEPVPRIAKDCADLLLQGSNNSGIHLTTEKFSNPEDVSLESKKFTGKTNDDECLPTRKPDSSAIDIFVKRKRDSLDAILGSEIEKNEGINTVKNNCADEFYTYLENDKMAALRYQDDTVHDRELIDDKSDAINVGARMYLSHNCDIDNTFSIDFNDLADNPKVGPSIVTFAQFNRVVGDQDVRLVSRTGESFVDLDEKGNVVAKASKDSGHQFLSLGVDGTSRLQAKQEIHLAVRTDDAKPGEPYVLVSELEKVLNEIITTQNIIMGALVGIGAAATKFSAFHLDELAGFASSSTPLPSFVSIASAANSVQPRLTSTNPQMLVNILAPASILRSKKIFGE